MSSHSEGLGSRNGWNSPDQTNSRWPSTMSEYGSKVIVCAVSPAPAGPSAAGLALNAPLATAAPAAAGRTARPAAARAVPDSKARREITRLPPAAAG